MIQSLLCSCADGDGRPDANRGRAQVPPPAKAGEKPGRAMGCTASDAIFERTRAGLPLRDGQFGTSGRSYLFQTTSSVQSKKTQPSTILIAEGGGVPRIGDNALGW